MGMPDRKDWPKGMTPRAVFVYPRLNAPDTKYKEHGEWSVKLRLSEAVAQPLIDALNAYLPTAIEAAEADAGCKLSVAQHPVKPAADGPANARVPVPGFVDITFKKSAGGRYQTGQRAGEVWVGTLNVFPAKGDKQVTEDIWGGTEGRVAYRIKPWHFGTQNCGVKFEIEAVKILKLVSKGERAASDFGFEDEEGYEGPLDGDAGYGAPYEDSTRDAGEPESVDFPPPTDDDVPF